MYRKKIRTRRIVIGMFFLLLMSNLYAQDYSDRNLVGIGWTYTFPHGMKPAMFGANFLFTPLDFITGFSAMIQSDFGTDVEVGLGIERYIFLIPSNISNQRQLHLSVGAMGTYSSCFGLGYCIYATAGFAIPLLQGIGMTVIYDRTERLAFRLEYSGAVFLEKKPQEDLS